MRLLNEAQNLEFAKSLGSVEALIKEAPTQSTGTVVTFPSRLVVYLRRTRDTGRILLTSMRQILDLTDEQQTDDLLYQALAHASWVVDSMNNLLETGAQVFKEGALKPIEWPEDVVAELQTLLEDFDDFQETIALGLSDEFRKELEAAKLATTPTESRS
jgi:hypothetical protein